MNGAICIAGKNDIATNVLEFVVKRYGVENVIAIANRDDTGQPSWQHSLINTAQRLGVQLASLEDVYNVENLHFFSVEFDRIIVPSKFVNARIYNIHFSLLPRYKGVYTAIWPILNGDSETGVTLHYIEPGIDTGPIIHQRRIAIGLFDTARDVYYNCLRNGYEVLKEFIPQLVQNPPVSVKQSEVNSTYFGPKSIDFSNIEINLRQTAYQIHNVVRAFTFQEYQLPVILGRLVRASRITDQISIARPGVILEEDDKGFLISTIDYDLYLFKDYSFLLIESINQQNYGRVLEIIDLVPNLEVRTRQGWTPLMIAAYRGDLSVVIALIEAGANVNATNKKGTSVLMYAKTSAISSNSLQLMEYLLDNGADASVLDEAGKSILDYALEDENELVTSFLSSL